MYKIDQRFLEELINQKQVSIQPDLYKRLYRSIWPCEDYFREFLMEADPSVKLDKAKKIFDYMQVYSDIVFPYYYVNNVISNQMTKLVGQQNYLPQDHVIHSIYTYILGIYLFFNFPLFFQKVTETECNKITSLYERVKAFIEQWRLFALYHDVGYYLEANVNKNGIITREGYKLLGEYRQIFEKCLYHHLLRSTAKLVSLIALYKRSHLSFSTATVVNPQYSEWIDRNNCPEKSENITNSLKDFEHAIQLRDISSANSFKCFAPLFSKHKYLVLLTNDFDTPVGILIVNHSIAEQIYIQPELGRSHSALWKEHTVENILSGLPDGLSCSFFVPNLKSIIQTAVPEEYEHLVFEFYDNLPQNLHEQYSFIQGDKDIWDCYHNIYLWLRSKTEQYICDGTVSSYQKMFDQEMSDHYKAAFINNIRKRITNELQGDFIDAVNLEETIASIFAFTKKKTLLRELVAQVHEDAASAYNEECGISQNVLQYFFVSYANALYSLEKDTTNPSRYDWRTLSFVQTTREKTFNMQLFAHSTNCDPFPFDDLLYKNIKAQAEMLKINFNDLCGYVTSYSACDHGLASAGMLYQAAVIADRIAEYSMTKNQIVSLAWSDLKNVEKRRCGFCNTVAKPIFSMLLHNIYSKKNCTYGLAYEQNIDINPFAYFAATCDVLQVWNRPKQLDYSKTNLPYPHYLEENFDMMVKDGKINIICGAEQAGALRSKYNNNQDFLPGFNRIVRICG